MQLKFIILIPGPTTDFMQAAGLKSRKACLFQIKRVILDCKNITTESLAGLFSLKESSQVIFAWFLFS